MTRYIQNSSLILLLLIGSPLLMGNFLSQSGTLIGEDNDNNLNSFIQPPGNNSKQHMQDTDVLIGGAGGDLLIGMLGHDVLLGQAGDDILVGGAENFRAGVDETTGEDRGSNGDVLLGGAGDDINIWSPGDGSDAFLGGAGDDSIIFAPLVHPDGDKNTLPSITQAQNRDIVQVKMDALPQFSCVIESLSADAGLLHYNYIVRFLVNGDLKVTVRLAETEGVFCPSPQTGKLLFADLTSASPTTFVEQDLADYAGSLLGDIMQAP